MTGRSCQNPAGKAVGTGEEVKSPAGDGVFSLVGGVPVEVSGVIGVKVARSAVAGMAVVVAVSSGCVGLVVRGTCAWQAARELTVRLKTSTNKRLAGFNLYCRGETVLSIMNSILEFEDKFRNYNFILLSVHVTLDSV